MGELHLEIICDRLGREFGVPINQGKPQVSYRESITYAASATGSFHKELAGKIRFGEVTLEVAPNNGEGLVFATTINKRTLPEEILESIEQSVKDASLGGVIAGHALTNIKVTLTSAPYNEEESFPVAYAIAASDALRQACLKAAPVLLEPIMLMEVITPAQYTGDVVGDINSKRGKILNMGIKQNKDLIEAEIPLAETFGHSTDLRSRTQGRASFSMKFLKYEVLPEPLAKALLEKRGLILPS
jgi:elongation factor G